MNQKFASEVAQFVAVSQELNSRLMQQLAEKSASEKSASARKVEILDHLQKAGCVSPANREKAASMLGDHSQTLSLLANTATQVSRLRENLKKANAELGTVSDRSDKTASVSSAADGPFVGRHTSQKRASDAVFLSILNQ